MRFREMAAGMAAALLLAAARPAAGDETLAAGLAGKREVELRIALTGEVDHQRFGPLAATLRLGRDPETGERTVAIGVDADLALGSLLWLPAKARLLEARDPVYRWTASGPALEIRIENAQRYPGELPSWTSGIGSPDLPQLRFYSQATGGRLRLEAKADGVYGSIELKGLSWASRRPNEYRAEITPFAGTPGVVAPPAPVAAVAIPEEDQHPGRKPWDEAERLLFAGKYAEAAELFEQALAIYGGRVRGDGVSVGNRISQRQLLVRLMVCHFKSPAPDYPRLLADLEALVEVDRRLRDTGYLEVAPDTTRYSQALENWRERLAGDRDKVAALEGSQEFLEILLLYFLDQNRFDLALEVAEMARARAYADLLAKRSSRVLPPETLSFADMKRLAATRPGPVVEYFATERFLAIWTLDPTGALSFTTVPVSRDDLERTLARVEAAIAANARANAGSPLRADLHRLHGWLLEPIAAHLPADPAAAVTIVGHGQLQRLSFAALPFGDGPLDWVVFHHALLYLPSLAVLEQLEARDCPRPELELAAFLDPQPLPRESDDRPWGPIPGAPQMSAALELVAPGGSRFSGSAASETSFKEAAGRARILFMATHAFAERAGWRPTAVLLGKDQRNDGYLVPEELEKLELSAELVVLTACETGRGELKADGVQGLARSFFTAGARLLLATLWEVPAGVAPQETIDFLFEREVRGIGTAEALRRALAEQAETYRDQPRMWAGLVLFG